ncbi:MAG: UbiA family prenyltransferase, partial [Candidatus Altarchaeaceae archaeon]
MRIGTSGLASLAVLCAIFIEVNFHMFDIYLFQTIIAIIAIFVFVSAGNSLNDYFDREIDKINHPERPIPSGKIKPRNALIFSIILFLISLILSSLINIISFFIVLFAMTFQILYELKFKNHYITKNFTISFLTAMLFVFGSVVVNNEIKISPSFILGVLSFFAIFGREIIKDIEDYKGDKERLTIPKKIGIKNASYISSFFILLSVILSPLPYIILKFNLLYLVLVLITDIIFIYSLKIQIENPKKARKNIKIG